MISYAQNFEDVILWRVLKDVVNGCYVDVGAFHPEVDSVTRWFYDQGWSGINVEPVEDSFALLAAARPRDRNLRLAAADVAGTVVMTVFPRSRGLSTLRPRSETLGEFAHDLIAVETRPLRDILQPFAGKPIHFLKIDAEGSEREVLLGMDFEHFRPWIVVVEATVPRRQEHTATEWEDTLLASNYRPAYFDGLNQFFVAAERIELAPRLAVPPNVFDDFELATTVRERLRGQDEQRRLQAQVDEMMAQATARDQELAITRDTLAAANETIEAMARDAANREHELAAAREELASLNGMIAEMTREAASRERAFATARDDIARLLTTNTSLRNAISEQSLMLDALRRDLAAIAEAARYHREQYARIINSRSWRWLLPVRRMRTRLRIVRASLTS